MMMSQLIDVLYKAMQRHGDLPVYTSNADIGRVVVKPCRDGVVISGNALEVPNEFEIEITSS